MRRVLALRALLVAAALLTGGDMSIPDLAAQSGPTRAVYINRTKLPADTLQLFESRFGLAIPDGRYWYDALSGGWGQEGGPALGFTYGGLPLGGPLPADISGGGTGVYVNGRELHPMDLLGLQQLVGPVMPGRYWLDAEGFAGPEGGPPVANLRALAAQGLSRQGRGVNENYGNGGSAYGNLNTGIGVITDGEGGAAVFSR